MLLIYQAATGALATDHSALVILLATYCPLNAWPRLAPLLLICHSALVILLATYCPAERLAETVDIEPS